MSSHRRAESAVSLAGTKRKREDEETEDDRAAHDVELYGGVRANKRPKFILVDNPTGSAQRVRVRVQLEQVDLREAPDSYRKGISVYPRAYFPVQMEEFPDQRQARAGGRWLDDGVGSVARPSAGTGTSTGGAGEDDGFGRAVTGKAIIKIGNLNGGEGVEESDDDTSNTAVDGGRGGIIGGRRGKAKGEITVAIPGLSQEKRKKEALINELGYRMSWSQSRVFSGRIQFLQKSLDAYRTKMKTAAANAATAANDSEDGTMMRNSNPLPIPHFEVRVGKKKWLAGKKKTKDSNGDDD